MYDLHYVMMDPAGNRTLLVETAVPEELHPSVASELMKKEPSAEQVGFITIKDGVHDPARPEIDLSLRMAGGEFCGNASMSAAALLGMRRGRTGGQVLLHVSGSPGPVRTEISAMDDGVWQGIVDMPGPETIETVRFPDGQQLPVVSFPGISHVIVDKNMDPDRAETLIREWCGFLKADALGLLFLDLDTGQTGDQLSGRVTPLVYVPAADTLFWESACGSGTSAVGAWLANEEKRPVKAALRQPGGVLEIEAFPDGKLLLKGTVRFLYEKTASI